MDAAVASLTKEQEAEREKAKDQGSRRPKSPLRATSASSSSHPRPSHKRVSGPSRSNVVHPTAYEDDGET